MEHSADLETDPKSRGKGPRTANGLAQNESTSEPRDVALW